MATELFFDSINITLGAGITTTPTAGTVETNWTFNFPSSGALPASPSSTTGQYRILVDSEIILWTAGTVATGSQPGQTVVRGQENTVPTTHSATAALNIIVSSGSLLNMAQLATSGAQAGSIDVSGSITGSTLTSTAAVGTAPLTVTSTTLVANLNAAQVGGLGIAALGQLATAATWSALQTYSAGINVTSNIQLGGSAGAVGNVLTSAGAGATPTWSAPAATGVTSVGLALPTIFSITGSPVTTTGTLTAAFATQTASLALMGPVSGGTAAVPTFRAIAANDIAATGNLNIGSGTITSGAVTSSAGIQGTVLTATTTTTAPLVVSSTYQVNNLNAEYLGGNSSIDYSLVQDKVLSNTAPGTAFTIPSPSSDEITHLTLSAALTLTFPVAGIGLSFVLYITQTTTAYGVTWPATVIWPGGVAPTLSGASHTDSFSFICIDGTNWYGYTTGQNF